MALAASWTTGALSVGVARAESPPQPTWTQLSVPQVRTAASTAYDASTGQLILFGGQSSPYAYDADTWQWNGSGWTELYPPTSPSGRAYASMAYDPASGQLVLFGGYGGGEILSDTWSWNGSTWTELSPAASPPSLEAASMAYDPTLNEVVLFGGFDGNELRSDTWAWDGSTWTDLSPATSPPARDGASMAFDPQTDQLVLVAGSGQSGSDLGDTWVFDGTNWTQQGTSGTGCEPWCPRVAAALSYDATTGQLILAGGSSTSFALQDTWSWNGSVWQRLVPQTSGLPFGGAPLAYDAGTGQLVLFGGSGGNGAPTSDTWTWDGSEWSDVSASATPAPRDLAASAYDSSTGQVVLFGGDSSDGVAGLSGTTWLFDGSNWAHGPTGPPARSDSTMAFDPATNQIVLFGGAGDSGWLGDTWTFDGSSWTKQAPVDSPSARIDASLAWDSATSQLILFGGIAKSGDALGDTWTWDGSNWTELSPATSPPARSYASMADDPGTGQLVLFGGRNEFANLTYADTWTWDGSNWTEQCVSGCTSIPARSGASMAYEATTGQLVLFGGVYSTLSKTVVYGDTWTWDGSNWTEQAPAGAPQVRFFASMTYDTLTGLAVLFGGNGGTGCGTPGGTCNELGDTWTFDGSNWSQLIPQSAPQALSQGAMAYDPGTGQMVMFGGDLGGTWVFDGSSWTEFESASEPSVRSGASMAYDAATGQLILFGGVSDGNGLQYFDDTWAWDGSSWTELSPATSPPARADASMSYDATLGDIVLFGGEATPSDGSATSLGDTWIFDGSSWTELFPATSPTPRYLASMTYDAGAGQLVLFGGADDSSSDFLGDTWTFDGTTWTEQSPATSPPGRYSASMAYDPGLAETVLFGGYSDSTGTDAALADTWSWEGSNWSRQSPEASPSARRDASMVYDAALGQLVVFGGAGGSSLLNDTWGYAPDQTASVLSLSESDTSVKYGEENADRFSVSVTGTSGGPAPTGDVAVEDIVTGFPVTICSVTSLIASGTTATGTCKASATTLPAGTDLTLAVTARYAGDSSHATTAAKVARTLKVAKAKSTTSLALSMASVAYGQEQAETFTASVSPQYSGSPTGRVSIKVGSKVLCSATLSQGQASCSLSNSQLPAGTYSVTASYPGNVDFASSKSATHSLTVT